MKQGRGRIYLNFGNIESELDFLSELHARAEDLIEDLPDDIYTAEMHGHSIKQLMDHMIDGERSWISKTADIKDFPDISNCEELARFTKNALDGLVLDSEISVGPFTSVGQVVRHLEWHWTYHSAQIGFLRKSLGHEYKWTYA